MSPLSRQLSNTLSRQRSLQSEGRLDERRGLSHKFSLFPSRPHSSNTSRPSSTNTSSSSLRSLLDQAISESGVEHCLSKTASSPSSATPRGAIDGSHPAPLSPLSEISRDDTYPDDLPVYPDQSYAVLQRQRYPTPYPPPLVRSRSSYPCHQSRSSHAPAQTWTDDLPERSPTSRTVGNTPISSPGLFSAQLPTSVGDGHTHRSYLHPTHLQEPKE